MRKNIVDTVNSLSKEYSGYELDLLLMYNLIFKYQSTVRKPLFKMRIEIIDGVLFIDSTPLERVAPLVKPFNIVDLKADYYESRIIMDYDD